MSFDLTATAVALLLVVLAPRLVVRASRPLRSGLSCVNRGRNASRVSVGLVFVVAFALGVVATWVSRPVPRMLDEFSYLLAADTFAHGRVTNPPHPFWKHFESIHIIQQPTYQSKYPPGIGLMLALGQVLFGDPLVGAWLSHALAAAAACWMLQAWVPPRMALLGGLLAALHGGFLLGWGQSYWGGALAMCGGALVYGAMRRVLRNASVPHVLVLGAGLFILAVTRPVEGLVACVPVVATLLWAGARRVATLLRNRPQRRDERRSRLDQPLAPQVARLTAALAAVAAGIVGFQAWYNHEVTGNALRMPYQVHLATYDAAPLFIWQPLPAPKEYRHKELRDFHTGTPVKLHQRQQTPRGFAIGCAGKLLVLARFYLTPAWTLPLLMLPWILRRGWMRWGAAAIALVLCALFAEVYCYPHYVAPAASLYVLLVVQGLRHLSACRWLARRRINAAALLVLLTGASLAWRLHALPAERAASPALLRAQVQQKLESLPGEHLVFVRYSENHASGMEWVYNRAEIDQAKVVWARRISPEEDLRLRQYFYSRPAWLLDADARPPRIELVKSGNL